MICQFICHHLLYFIQSHRLIPRFSPGRAATPNCPILPKCDSIIPYRAQERL